MPLTGDKRRRYQREWLGKIRGEARDVAIPALQSPFRRRLCRNNLARFLKTYLKSAFPLPWSRAHKTFLKKLEHAILHGGLFVIAMPRGAGKTTIAEGAALWAVVYGHRRYVVLIGATAKKAQKNLDTIKSWLRFEPKLCADFPEVCVPVQALKGIAQRARFQTIEGEPTMIEWTTECIVLPTVAGSVSSGTIIESVGITGDIRGRKYTTKGGAIRRPDFAIPDDPQTGESARSPSQCKDRERTIIGDVLNLAGPGEEFTAVMPCTIIRQGDLAARFLNHGIYPDWQGEITSMLLSMPADMELWDGYNEIRKEGVLGSDDGRAANKFYRRNRKALEKGAEVSWQNRKLPTEVSPIQHAMNLYFRLGKVIFSCEYQNDPIEEQVSVYLINEELVRSRVNGFEAGVLPEDTIWLTGMVDINYVGLHWIMLAATSEFAGYVVQWGKWPEGERDLFDPTKPKGKTDEQAIYEGLDGLLSILTGELIWKREGEDEPIIPDQIMIDCGSWWMQTVFSFCRHFRGGCKVLPSRGRASKQYRQRTVIGRPGNNLHLTRFAGKGLVVIHNADYWRMRAQKAFLLPPGAPGSISLYGSDGARHTVLADHICGEKLIEFVKGDMADYYNWILLPGARNDLLDALVGSMVGASRLGAAIPAGGAKQQQQSDDSENSKAAEPGRSWLSGGGIPSRRSTSSFIKKW